MADPLAALVSAQSETEPTSTVMNAPVVASEQPAPVPLQPTITSSSDEPLNAIALLQPDNNAADDATANLTHSDTGDESTTHDGKASLSASSVGESTIPFQEAGTKEATAISKTNAQRILSEVSTQLSDLASYSSDGSQRRLLIQLHPAELGQVALQVEWNDDRLTAKIVANDSATSEMLAQNKPRLVEALAENGIELDAFEVAHQNDPDHQAFQQNESGQNISLSKRANESGPSTQVHPDHDDANQRLNLLI
ncbi:MAG: flagellar hook-length control protein FliK [Planctomycetota bacterium]